MELITRNSVATYNSLPITGNILGDCRKTSDTGKFYMWTSLNNDDTRDNWRVFLGEDVGGTGDMLKSVYDVDDNGIVDKASSLDIGADTKIEIIVESGSDEYIKFTEDNSEIMRITNGKVGIGTTEPGAKLEVFGGEIWMFEDGGSPRFVIGDTAAAGNYGYMQWNSANDYLDIRVQGAGTQLIVASGGNVGIGTTSPSQKLDIVAGGSGVLISDTGEGRGVAKSLFFGDGGGTWTPIMWGVAGASSDAGLHLLAETKIADDSGTEPLIRLNARQIDSTPITTRPLLAIENDGSQLVTVDKDGNVGIGVADPDTTLEVLNAGTQAKLSYDGSNFITFAVQSDGDLTINSNKAGYDLDFEDGNLKTSGNFTDGTNASSPADVKDAVDKKHSQNTDTQLGAMAADINMNSKQLGSLAVPDANGEAIRQTTKITETNLEDSVDKKHASGGETMGGDVSGTVGNASVKIDDFTIKKVSNTLKLADRIEQNILLNAFRIAINGSLVKYNMVDGIVDEFEDESGVNTGLSVNEDYDADNDLYKPSGSAGAELDYMEYANDAAAQAAYAITGYHSITFEDAAQLDTSIKKWGSASLMLDGDGDYLILPDNADWDISTNFTIDFQIKFADHVGEEYLIGQYEDAANRWQLVHTHGFGFNFSIKSENSWIVETGLGGEITDTEWHHIALCKVGNEYGIYVDEVQVLHTSDADMDTFAGDILIGKYGGGTSYFDGHFDELRIQHSNVFNASPDVGLTDTITPPTSAHQIDANTKLLLHFDGADEAVATKDSSRCEPYSESTIFQQGSYSLKAIAAQTDSLNDTLTKSGLSIDLSGVDTLKYYIYSEDRTGSHIKISIHDSGGTTTEHTANISSTGAWEEQTIDLSGVTDANKDDIDSIIVTIINADAANTFYIDNFYAVGVTNDMTLISEDFTAEAQPDNGRIVLFEEDVDAITENTDLKAYISRDGGSTYSQVTLVDEGDYGSSKRILSGLVDISWQPAGTTMKWKLTTHNSKSLKVHGIGQVWD